MLPPLDQVQSLKQEHRPFAIKCFNIMDLLLPSNNLGRSVARSNFLRIRRAFAHGSKTLAAIMEKVRWEVLAQGTPIGG